MVRRYKKSKREKEVVKRPPLSREEIEEKERQRITRITETKRKFYKILFLNCSISLGY